MIILNWETKSQTGRTNEVTADCCVGFVVLAIPVRLTRREISRHRFFLYC